MFFGDIFIGIGIGMGDDRAIEAAKQAVSSPLLETSIHRATDAIINITGGSNLTLYEAEQAAEVVRAAANTDINAIFGSVINENLTDEVIVTVIATGFDKKSNKQPLYNQINQTSKRTENKYDLEVLNESLSSLKNKNSNKYGYTSCLIGGLEEIKDDDEDSSSSSFEPTEIEIPTFMHKNF